MQCNTDLAIAPHLTSDLLPTVISCSGDLPSHGLIIADLEPPSHRLECSNQSGILPESSPHTTVACGRQKYWHPSRVTANFHGRDTLLLYYNKGKLTD